MRASDDWLEINGAFEPDERGRFRFRVSLEVDEQSSCSFFLLFFQPHFFPTLTVPTIPFLFTLSCANLDTLETHTGGNWKAVSKKQRKEKTIEINSRS